MPLTAKSAAAALKAEPNALATPAQQHPQIAKGNWAARLYLHMAHSMAAETAHDCKVERNGGGDGEVR